MKKIRVGVIGLGVGERHVRAYQSHPRVEVVALCDKSNEKLAEAKQKYGDVLLTREAGEVLCDKSIDVISIASYDADHFEQVVEGLKRGKHVFVEKPLCLHEEEARHIRQLLTERPDLRLSSHFPLRQVPRFRELKEQLAAGRLGRLFLAEADYHYGRWSKIVSGWRGKTRGYSVVLGGGVHMIDLLTWLTGETIVETTAYGTNIAGGEQGIEFDDCVVSLMKFRSGLVARMTCDLAGVHPHYHALSLYGTEATFINGRRTAEFFTSREGEPSIVTTPYQQERQTESAPCLTSFVDYVLGNGEPVVTGEEVFQVMSVAFAVVRSVVSGRPERVEYI